MERQRRTVQAGCAADGNRDAGPKGVAGARIRRDTGALSTFTGQAELSTLWKHEVSQRVAAHRKRKGSASNDAKTQAHGNSGGGTRLSAAAARVAARYAAAPSYSELFAPEISSAPMELEPPAEQIMLLDLRPSGTGYSSQEAHPVAALAEPAPLSNEATPVATLDWGFGRDLVATTEHPLNEALKRESHREGSAVDEPAVAMTMAQAQLRSIPEIEEHRPIWSEAAASWYEESPAVSSVDPQPIHGNLIEFPFELVAARKVRPRRAEGIYASVVDSEPQLSIFEVDPASVSTEPDAVEQAAETSAWSRPEWADLKLESSQPQAAVAERVAEVKASKAVELRAAPMNLRLLAAIVDFALISLAVMAVAALVAVNATVLPTIREAEIGGGLVFAAIAMAYLAISYTLARATPGMKYAMLSLRTFDGRRPTREQRCRRLGALALSMLPVGLGAVWALFDEEHLSWHDRWSGTYLRRV